MSQPHHFSDVLDAAERLSADEQLTLVEILRRRIAERGREQVLGDVQAARTEHAAGATRTTTVNDLISKIRS